MPRIPPHLLHTARRLNPYLAPLLRECRDIESAARELRWLREHVADEASAKRTPVSASSGLSEERTILRDYVKRRSRGEPLQYILGTQPFGLLDVRCEPGVLIPRPETETYTEILCDIVHRRIASGCQHLTVADFCTGTGCIALQLLASLQSKVHSLGARLRVRGFDISPNALRLARQNLDYNVELGVLEPSATDGDMIAFGNLDVLALAQLTDKDIIDKISEFYGSSRCLDVIVSNPPYISPEQFRPGGPTTRSVRNYEPKLALVPPAHTHFPTMERADQFYAALTRIAIASNTRLLAMEVGDAEQAYRVVNICRNMLRASSKPSTVDIWRDDGSVIRDADTGECDRSGTIATNLSTTSSHHSVHCRAVVIWFDPDWQALRGL